MNRKWKRAAVYTAAALLLTACGGGGQNTESSAAAEEKVIRIGCEATTPGWIQTDENGNLSGYDYDVWMEIGKRTGYKIEYQIMEWDGMWAMLNDERLDTVGEQISATDERREAYCLSEPYALFFASTFSSKMQSDFLKVAWGISPVLHFPFRHSFRCRRGAVAGIQSLLVTDM